MIASDRFNVGVDLLTSGELVDIQCIDVTNSTKFKLPLLSLSNVVNIKLAIFSTLSTGSSKLNISFTFSFPRTPYDLRPKIKVFN